MLDGPPMPSANVISIYCLYIPLVVHEMWRWGLRMRMRQPSVMHSWHHFYYCFFFFAGFYYWLSGMTEADMINFWTRK